MSPYSNLLVLIRAALLFGSVISHAPLPRPLSPVVQPPSVIHVPTPSPAVTPLSPVESPVPTPEVEPPMSPVEPPLVPPPSPVISPSFSPVVQPVYSPSISMPPAEAPAPESDAALNSVSIGLVTFGAIVVALMA